MEWELWSFGKVNIDLLKKEYILRLLNGAEEKTQIITIRK